MATNEERREVAARLRELDHEITSHDTIESGVNKLTKAVHGNTSFSPIGYSVRNLCGLANTLADLIDPTCVYEPTETLTRWDENDHEHETNEPDFYCETFACSRCGYEMIYGGEYGWFDTEPPYAPHFKFCPNCSARVLPLKLYDKVVTDDGE